MDKQGHRGCRGLLPENSIEGFKKAIELGVNTLELDVVISKDSIVVVSHEPFMSRTICLDPEGNEIPESMDMAHNLYQMTHDSIKQFDCGSKFHPKFPDQKKIKTYKPSLDEVIKISKALKPNIKYNIEIKSRLEFDEVYTPKPKEFVSLVLQVIDNNDALESCTLQSFDTRALEEVKKQAPKMEIALLIDEDQDINDKLSQLSFKPEIVSPYFKLLDIVMVRNLHAENYKIIPWTVNSEKDIVLMKAYEVDGIITDYPDRL